MRHIVIVHTGGGIRYASRIGRSIRWICNTHNLDIEVHLVPAVGRQIVSLLETLPKEHTVIHSRAAHPDALFMDVLQRYSNDGWSVINHPEALRLSSDKGRCAVKLQEYFSHPSTFLFTPPLTLMDIDRVRPYLQAGVIVKPTVSSGQGIYVKKLSWLEFITTHWWNDIPTEEAVVQCIVDYTAIYRVICIGGRALPYAFKDTLADHPDSWKVSVCLNRNQKFVPNPQKELLQLAEDVQTFIGGDINFIDIFEEEPGTFVLSEINTACSLFIHERLAKAAKHKLWNIHYQIARYLVDNLMRKE